MKKNWHINRSFAVCLAAFLLLSFPCGCDSGRAEAERARSEAAHLLEQGDFNRAVAPLRTVARLAPETPGVFSDLARSVSRSAQRQELLKEAETLLATKPNDPVALTIAASALLGKDDQRKRLHYLRSLVQIRPRDPMFKVTLAQDLVNAFLFDEASPLLDSLIQEKPDDPAGYYLRGQLNYFRHPNEAGLAQAESDFKKTLEMNANVARTHLFLGRVFLRQGKAQEAMEHLRAASESMPDNPDVHFELAKAFQAIGDVETAKRAQKEFARLREQAIETEAMAKRCGAFPDDFDLHLKTARLMMKKGDPEKAIYYVNRALTIRPNDPAGMRVAQELDRILTGGGPR